MENLDDVISYIENNFTCTYKYGDCMCVECDGCPDYVLVYKKEIFDTVIKILKEANK